MSLRSFVDKGRKLIAQTYSPEEERNKTGQWGGATPEHGGGVTPGGGGALANAPAAPVGNTPVAPVASPSGASSLSGPYSGYAPLSHTNPAATTKSGRKKSTGLHARVKGVRSRKSAHLRLPIKKRLAKAKGPKKVTALHKRVAKIKSGKAHAAHHFKLMGIHLRGHSGHSKGGIGGLPSSKRLLHGRNASFSKPLRPSIAPGTTRFHGMAKKAGASTRSSGGKKH